MKENDILEPDNLYGITKAAGTMYCQLMARKFNLPIVTMRPFAVYGYFEDKDRLIPTIIKACLTNTELKLANPNFVRDFIFIEDLINAYIKTIQNVKKAQGKVFNIGSGRQTNIATVVNLIKKITKSSLKPIYAQIQSVQTEPQYWQADISQAKRILSWYSRYTLEKGLEKDIKWFSKNISLYN
jgi:nucleoside-diphosphate-sugar epimerase